MVHEWLGGLNPTLAANVFKRLYCRRLMHAVEEIWLLCFKDIACEVFSLVGDTNLDTLKYFNYIKSNTENIAVSCGQTMIAQYLYAKINSIFKATTSLIKYIKVSSVRLFHAWVPQKIIIPY